MAMSPDALLYLGLLASATAIGLSPYSALAAVGLAGYTGLFLPQWLAGLAAPPVWGILIGLAALDAILSHYRVPDLVWSAGHSLVKPLAALLFASAALAQTPREVQWAAAMASLVAASVVHTWILALRTAARTAGPVSWLPGFTAVRLLSAALLAVLALTAAPYAATLAAVILFAPLPWSRRLAGTAALAIRSLLSTFTHAGRPSVWESTDSLPPAVRRAVEDRLGSSLGTARITRVTLARLGPRWTYRRGRLVLPLEELPAFVWRQGPRLRAVLLARAGGQADHGVLIETLRVHGPQPYTICLGPEAPPGTAILAEIQR
jgi:hypothetical protein